MDPRLCSLDEVAELAAVQEPRCSSECSIDAVPAGICFPEPTAGRAFLLVYQQVFNEEIVGLPIPDLSSASTHPVSRAPRSSSS